MGYEILYCAGCQAQLRGRDFEAGTAFRQEGAAYCETCAPASLKEAAARKQEATSVRQTPPTTRLHTRSTDTRRTPRARRQGSPVPAILAVSAAVVLGGGILLVAFAGSGSQPPPPAPASQPDPPRGASPPSSKESDRAVPPPPPPRQEEPAKEEEAARELERLLARSGDRRTRLARLREFAASYDGTFAAARARAKVKELDPPPEAPKETALFNGKDLSGWETVQGNPRFEGGELRLRKNEEVVFPLTATDFELTGRLRLNLSAGQAGIGFHRPGKRRGVGSRFSFYEDGDIHFRVLQDIAGRAQSGTFKLNTWHGFRLTVRGAVAVLEIDGREALRVEAPATEPGYLALYGNHVADGGWVAFKDLRLKP